MKTKNKDRAQRIGSLFADLAGRRRDQRRWADLARRTCQDFCRPKDMKAVENCRDYTCALRGLSEEADHRAALRDYCRWCNRNTTECDAKCPLLKHRAELAGTPGVSTQ